MNKQPISLFCFSLIIGIIIYYNNFGISLITAVTLFLTILIILILIVKKHSLQQIFSELIIISWCFLGFITTYLQSNKSKNHYTNSIEEKQIFNLKVTEINNSNINNKKYIVDVNSVSFNKKMISTSGKALFLVPKNIETLYIGNEYTILGKSNDIFEALNPHQFDYKKYCERKHIFKSIKLDSILSIEKHNSLVFKIKNYNQFLCLKVDSSNINDNSKELLKALILGDRSDMKKENIDAFSKSGIMHLIAISGLHINVIFGIIYWLLKLIFPRKKSITIIISLIFVWIFGVFVGLYSSVFRSCLMISIYYIFYFLNRKTDIYHSLALSALIILLFDVSELYSIGFQLSFIAVFSIVWLSKPFEKILKTKNRKINEFIINPLSVTLAAQLGTLPFVLYYFHQFSLLSFLANFLLIPYSSVIIITSIIELIVILILKSHNFTYILYDFLIEILNLGSKFISSIDIFLFRFISINYLEVLCLFIVFIFLKYFLLKPNWNKSIPIFLFLLIFQFSKLYNNITYSSKNEFIVFNQYKYSLLGFRSGRNIDIIYDRNDDIDKIQNFILNPYITGEKIQNIKLHSVEYPLSISWEEKNILVLNKKSEIIENLDFIILSKSPKIKLKTTNTEIIIDGSNYINYSIDSTQIKNKIWDTRKKGAFVYTYKANK